MKIGERNHMVLDLLCGRRVGEVELVREIGEPPDQFLERNIFSIWREEADAQTAIDVRSVYWT